MSKKQWISLSKKENTMNKTFTYTEINHDNFKFQHLAGISQTH